MANSVAPARVVTPAFAYMCSTWCPTVLGEMPRVAATCLFG